MQELCKLPWVVEHKFNHWRVSVWLKFVICNDPLCRSNETAGPWRAEQKVKSCWGLHQGNIFSVGRMPFQLLLLATSVHIVHVIIVRRFSERLLLRRACDSSAVSMSMPSKSLMQELCKLLSVELERFVFWNLKRFVPLCGLKEMHSKQRQLGGHEGLSMCDAKHVW